MIFCPAHAQAVLEIDRVARCVVCYSCERIVYRMPKPITFTEYQHEAERTSRHPGVAYEPLGVAQAVTYGAKDRMLNGLLGLAGESGEFLDLIKKHLYQGHPLDRDKARGELGDILWYLAEVASALDMDLGAVARENIDKLRVRYPDGFSEQRSINRSV